MEGLDRPSEIPLWPICYGGLQPSEEKRLKVSRIGLPAIPLNRRLAANVQLVQFIAASSKERTAFTLSTRSEGERGATAVIATIESALPVPFSGFRTQDEDVRFNYELAKLASALVYVEKARIEGREQRLRRKFIEELLIIAEQPQLLAQHVVGVVQAAQSRVAAAEGKTMTTRESAGESKALTSTTAISIDLSQVPSSVRQLSAFVRAVLTDTLIQVRPSQQADYESWRELVEGYHASIQQIYRLVRMILPYTEGYSADRPFSAREITATVRVVLETDVEKISDLALPLRAFTARLISLVNQVKEFIGLAKLAHGCFSGALALYMERFPEQDTNEVAQLVRIILQLNDVIRSDILGRGDAPPIYTERASVSNGTAILVQIFNTMLDAYLYNLTTRNFRAADPNISPALFASISQVVSRIEHAEATARGRCSHVAVNWFSLVCFSRPSFKYPFFSRQFRFSYSAEARRVYYLLQQSLGLITCFQHSETRTQAMLNFFKNEGNEGKCARITCRRTCAAWPRAYNPKFMLAKRIVAEVVAEYLETSRYNSASLREIFKFLRHYRDNPKVLAWITPYLYVLSRLVQIPTLINGEKGRENTALVRLLGAFPEATWSAEIAFLELLLLRRRFRLTTSVDNVLTAFTPEKLRVLRRALGTGEEVTPKNKFRRAVLRVGRMALITKKAGQFTAKVENPMLAATRRAAEVAEAAKAEKLEGVVSAQARDEKHVAEARRIINPLAAAAQRQVQSVQASGDADRSRVHERRRELAAASGLESLKRQIRMALIKGDFRTERPDIEIEELDALIVRACLEKKPEIFNEALETRVETELRRRQNARERFQARDIARHSGEAAHKTVVTLRGRRDSERMATVHERRRALRAARLAGISSPAASARGAAAAASSPIAAAGEGGGGVFGVTPAALAAPAPAAAASTPSAKASPGRTVIAPASAAVAVAPACVTEASARGAAAVVSPLAGLSMLAAASGAAKPIAGVAAGLPALGGGAEVRERKASDEDSDHSTGESKASGSSGTGEDASSVTRRDEDSPPSGLTPAASGGPGAKVGSRAVAAASVARIVAASGAAAPAAAGKRGSVAATAALFKPVAPASAATISGTSRAHRISLMGAKTSPAAKGAAAPAGGAAGSAGAAAAAGSKATPIRIGAQRK